MLSLIKSVLTAIGLMVVLGGGYLWWTERGKCEDLLFQDDTRIRRGVLVCAIEYGPDRGFVLNGQ